MCNLIEFYTCLYDRADRIRPLFTLLTSPSPLPLTHLNLHSSQFTLHPSFLSIEESLAETRYRLDSLHLVVVES